MNKDNKKLRVLLKQRDEIEAEIWTEIKKKITVTEDGDFGRCKCKGDTFLIINRMDNSSCLPILEEYCYNCAGFVEDYGSLKHRCPECGKSGFRHSIQLAEDGFVLHNDRLDRTCLATKTKDLYVARGWRDFWRAHVNDEVSSVLRKHKSIFSDTTEK